MRKYLTSLIRTSYSEEEYTHEYIENGYYEQNGLYEFLASVCFCDDYEVIRQRESTGEEIENMFKEMREREEEYRF